MRDITLKGLKDSLRQPYLAYCRRRQVLPRPYPLDLAVTWRCNARWVMCGTWRSEELNPEGVACKLSVAQWTAILERDAGFLRDVRKVGLTDGEPFLRSDLVELVEL